MNLHLPPELLPLLAERLGWALLHSVWQGALAAAALALTLPFLRSASARHAVCLLVLLGLAATVAATFALARSAQPFSGVSTATLATAHVAEAPRSSAAVPLATPSNDLPPTLAAASPERRSWRERFEPMVPRLSWAWSIGVALLTLRQLLGWQRIRAIRRTGVEARPELQRTFARLLETFGCTVATRLLESAHVTVPMLAGLVKPAVLLPLRVVTGLRPCEIEAILAHELAHLVRRDAWSNLAQVAIETLFFYHPAVWWIGRRARQEREMAADDLALSVCTDRRVYAGALAQLAELEGTSPVALAATGGSLLARIQRIVRPERIESPAAGWSLCLPPLLVALALALTTIFRAEAEPPKPTVTAEQSAAKSETLAKPWLADAFQLDDAAKREAAIERIRTAMRSADADEARAGITAFQRIAAVEFDKPSFRPEVRTLLGSADAPTRAGAASAIAIIGGEPEDVERILALADDPTEEVRAVLTGVIVRLKKNDLRDQAASDAILKLMAKLPRDSRSVAHALWGSQLSAEIEARVLEFTRNMDRASNGDTGYNFFYGTLSTQANKSETTVRRLIELLAHEDITNIAGRAAWGLQQGVDRAQYPLVADAMVKVIEARSDGYLRNHALRCLRTYGSGPQVPALREIIARPGVTGDFRKALTEILATLEKRWVATNRVAVESIEDEIAKLKTEVEAGRAALGALKPDERAELLEAKVFRAERLLEKLTAGVAGIKLSDRKFTILGQVAKPGTYSAAWDRPLHLLEAVGIAGGFTPRADRDGIIVRRTSESGAETTLKVSAKRLLESSAEPFYIQSGDVISVGATGP